MSSPWHRPRGRSQLSDDGFLCRQPIYERYPTTPSNVTQLHFSSSAVERVDRRTGRGRREAATPPRRFGPCLRVRGCSSTLPARSDEKDRCPVPNGAGVVTPHRLGMTLAFGNPGGWSHPRWSCNAKGAGVHLSACAPLKRPVMMTMNHPGLGSGGL